MCTITWPKPRLETKVTLFTSEQVEDSINLKLSYSNAPPVFLVSSRRYSFFITLNWRDELKKYKGTGRVKCTVCKETNPSKNTVVRSASLPSTSDQADLHLNNHHVGSTSLILCLDCSESVDIIMRELVEENTSLFISDKI